MPLKIPKNTPISGSQRGYVDQICKGFLPDSGGELDFRVGYLVWHLAVGRNFYMGLEGRSPSVERLLTIFGFEG
jgi:hypothetical protein